MDSVPLWGEEGEWILVFLVLIVCLFLAVPARAHNEGVSQLRLHIVDTRVEGEWEIHYGDALSLLGQPATEDDEAAWSLLQQNDEFLRKALQRNLHIMANNETCSLQVLPDSLRRNPKQGTVLLGLSAYCNVAPTELAISYDILFEVDPRHRGYFTVRDDRVTHVGVFKENERSVSFEVHRFRWMDTIMEFTWEGMWHIWTGFDHVLFLLALLLPAALVRNGSTWTPRNGLWPTGLEVLKVVTAFTLAHSVTLVLAYLRVIVWPQRPVEAVIAFSVFLAAWNNLRPFLRGRTWLLALTFGLVHGLGFAAALSGLSLPHQARSLALVTFNVGVELGQIAIVVLILPLLYLISRWRPYPRGIMGVGSLLIAWVALIWTFERALGVGLFR